MVTNNSKLTLRLEGLNHVHEEVCNASLHCHDGRTYEMDFEGRPEVGSEIPPGGSARFDLKYPHGLLNRIGYAAVLKYKVEHTETTLYIQIETTPYENNSSCRLPEDYGPSHYPGRCTAGGLDINYIK